MSRVEGGPAAHGGSGAAAAPRGRPPAWVRAHRSHQRAKLVGLTALALGLYVGAAAGLSDIPGYSREVAVLGHVAWRWVFASLAGVVAAFFGYRAAWIGTSRHPGFPRLSRRQRWATAMAGFGGFIVRGGSALDRYVLVSAGADERDADVRVACMDALEHLPLAVACCSSGIYLLARGRADPPPLDFIWPWAVAPPIGAALAALAVARYRDRLRERRGVARWIGVALDGIAMLWLMVKEGEPAAVAVPGMTLFWAGEIFALWAGMAAFGFKMSIPSVILADAVGYVLTRRSAPFAGAGFIDTSLTLCLWDCGAPLAVAIAGVFTYRFFSLVLPLPACFAALPELRRLGGADATEAPEVAVRSEAASRHGSGGLGAGETRRPDREARPA